MAINMEVTYKKGSKTAKFEIPNYSEATGSCEDSFLKFSWAADYSESRIKRIFQNKDSIDRSYVILKMKLKDNEFYVDEIETKVFLDYYIVGEKDKGLFSFVIRWPQNNF